MELILLPILLIVQFTAYLLMAIVGLVFNLLFRSDKVNLLDDEKQELKPENPWVVFLYSVVATLMLALISGGFSYYIWGTSSAALTGFTVIAAFGLLASLSAADGQAPPM
ncbi:hypothetical protein OAG71_02500 [bacterium]|nr:hypothetical protein [bacterium]